MSTLEVALFHIEEEATKSNTNSAIRHKLYCRDVGNRFPFLYPKVACDPINRHVEWGRREESESSCFPYWCSSFCVCFFFTHLLPSSICSVLSSSLVQHKGMNFCMRSNMRYLGVNNWCTWPLQYLFPKEEFVQNSSCVTKFEDRHCPSTFVLD